MRKNLKVTLLIIFTAILLILIFIPVHRAVDKRMACTVLDQENADYRGQITLILHGTYTDYLFLQDHFEGRIDLADHDLYHGSNPIFNIDIGTFEHSNLMYVDSTRAPHYPGSFYASEDLETCFLWLMVPDELDSSRASGRYFITYPDLDFEQLYQIIDK